MRPDHSLPPRSTSSLAVWLHEGLHRRDPARIEEAALVDGYSRFAAFRKIILPQATTGMAVTAVFCLISAWKRVRLCDDAQCHDRHGEDRAGLFRRPARPDRPASPGRKWPQARISVRCAIVIFTMSGAQTPTARGDVRDD
jgi:hypothetical protein